MNVELGPSALVFCSNGDPRYHFIAYSLIIRFTYFAYAMSRCTVSVYIMVLWSTVCKLHTVTSIRNIPVMSFLVLIRAVQQQ